MMIPPPSDTVSGFTAAAGTWLATRSTPPRVTGADAAPELDGLLLAPPQAARIAPIVGTERPIMLPRRKKSRRFRRPASSSSM